MVRNEDTMWERYINCELCIFIFIEGCVWKQYEGVSYETLSRSGN